jgi:Ser/Thr protein kinase RdoA (MazF antagonist)
MCRTLRSYINRVFEVTLEDEAGVIIKFYRPGRWNIDALRDEQEFLVELFNADVRVIAPMQFVDGTTLGSHDGVYFAIFPKRSGRGLDEPSEESWEALGRLIGRMHEVGALHPSRGRITISPATSMRTNLATLLSSGFIPGDLVGEYEREARAILKQITPMFEGVAMHRIHGDCHPANIIHRPDEGFYLIDFDDMAMGPAVQDLWLLLPGYSRDSRYQISLFLEGYTTFRPFDKRTLALIEPLRAMRFLHYAAWCAVQAADGSIAHVQAGWGTTGYWKMEINDLRQQREIIEESREINWNYV